MIRSALAMAMALATLDDLERAELVELCAQVHPG